MIDCPHCGKEIGEVDFDKATLRFITVAEKRLVDEGVASLNNPDYDFLMKLKEQIKKSLELGNGGE